MQVCTYVSCVYVMSNTNIYIYTFISSTFMQVCTYVSCVYVAFMSKMQH